MRRCFFSALLVLIIFAACGESEPGLPDCSEVKQVLVTDIDETLTTLDAEFVQQLLDPNYEPAMRAGAAELMQAYAQRGFVIHYVTARAGTWVVGEDTSCEQATIDWLQVHGFPWGEGRAWLSLPEDVVTGEDTVAYKTAAIAARQAEGYTYVYAYGNAVTDIQAYAAAGIELQHVFSIGINAGAEGTQAIEEEDYLQHMAQQLPLVPAVCVFD